MTSSSGYGQIDNLTVGYDGNRIISVSDAASNVSYAFSHDFKNYTNQSTEYTYDGNGNMTKDLNRGISSVTYNLLNLPSQLEIKSPVGEARNDYVYGTDGAKLRVVHNWNPSYSSSPVIGSGVTSSSLSRSETTDYTGNYVYVDNSLKRVLTENGYIEDNAYYYYVKDHLGSVRVTANSSGVSRQSLNYYPFGMQFGDASGSDIQPYKYVGKEYDGMHGLNLYDSQARLYDPALGRFMTMDPLSEKYYSWSTYGYCMNNPVRFIDSNGVITDVTDKNVGDIFDKKFNSSTIIPTERKYKGNFSAHVIDEYNLLNNNCTTVVVDALTEAGTTLFNTTRQIINRTTGDVFQVKVRERPVVPVFLRNYLNTSSITTNRLIYKTK